MRGMGVLVGLMVAEVRGSEGGVISGEDGHFGCGVGLGLGLGLAFGLDLDLDL